MLTVFAVFWAVVRLVAWAVAWVIVFRTRDLTIIAAAGCINVTVAWAAARAAQPPAARHRPVHDRPHPGAGWGASQPEYEAALKNLDAQDAP